MVFTRLENDSWGVTNNLSTFHEPYPVTDHPINIVSDMSDAPIMDMGYAVCGTSS